MLRLALLELCETQYSSTLKHWHLELQSAVIHAGADWQWCVELVENCLQNKEIVELIRGVVKGRRNTDKCTMVSGSTVAAATLLIEQAQPCILWTKLEMDVATPPQLEEFFRQVARDFKGKLWLKLNHSLFNYQPCDSHVTNLENAE